MRVPCECGEFIYDGSDNLPDKGHVIPDQEWFATFDALDDEVIGPLSRGEITPSKAGMLARLALSKRSGYVHQCSKCGRLYIGLGGMLHAFLPAHPSTPREVLRSRDREA